jgi:hypothetical protein
MAKQRQKQKVYDVLRLKESGTIKPGDTGEMASICPSNKEGTICNIYIGTPRSQQSPIECPS